MWPHAVGKLGFHSIGSVSILCFWLHHISTKSNFEAVCLSSISGVGWEITTMPHLPKNISIPLGKPNIYGNQNKKAWERRQPQQESVGKNTEPYNIYCEQAFSQYSQNRIRQDILRVWEIAAHFSFHWPDQLFSSTYKRSKKWRLRGEMGSIFIGRHDFLSHLIEQKTPILHLMKAKKDASKFVKKKKVGEMARKWS